MHLYVHVPFCARRCSYCDFAIAVRKTVPAEAYVAAVLREWKGWLTHPIWHGAGREVRTVYFGGGTPSRLAPDGISRILERIARDRPLAAGAEVTLEANPEDVTARNARAWRLAGVTRVSLGVQSFDPGVLRWMHRTHTADHVPHALDALRAGGIEGVSVDLIFGLPSALQRDWEQDLQLALALQPDHVSLYGLTIEDHTPLSHWAGRGEVTPVDDERYAVEYLAANAALEAAGYEHYEVSNAARAGHRARHNSAYWRRDPFIGLGPSAHSGWGVERQWNVRDWVAYQRALEVGPSAVAGSERLDDRAVALEELYLGLRTRDGIPAEWIDADDRCRWMTSGWATETGTRVRLTAEGWLRLDALVRLTSSRFRSTL